jgi:DNA-binding MarR family transcriptional regulator
MNKYKLLAELLPLLEEFENTHSKTDIDLSHFLAWLAMKNIPQQSYMNNIVGDKTSFFELKGLTPEAIIAQSLSYLNRYAKFYVKEALKDTGIQTGEEYTYLSILLNHPSLTKTELINLNVQEKTTGADIIKRLLAAEYIDQFDDEQDKRSKRVRLSPKGREVLLKCSKNMRDVSILIAANLTHTEKINLALILNKLGKFHQEHFKPDRDFTIKDLIEKINF